MLEELLNVEGTKLVLRSPEPDETYLDRVTLAAAAVGKTENVSSATDGDVCERDQRPKHDSSLETTHTGVGALDRSQRGG